PWFQRMERIVHGLGVSLNTEKTRIVDAADGFDFLGMRFRLKPMRSNPKRLYCYRWPSTKAMQSVRQKVRGAVGYDNLYSLADKIRALNPILDRKSTRLNSSHVEISYAVFCSRKKTPH